MAHMHKQKYIRIQVRYNGKTGKPVGIFGACHHVVYNKYHNFNSTDEDRKVFEEIDSWFNEHLPNPPFYEEGNVNNYITWFKKDAAESMIEKLTPLMKILEKYNVPYDIVHTNFIGKIVYEDDYQVAVE
jgi:hypothetical protein